MAHLSSCAILLSRARYLKQLLLLLPPNLSFNNKVSQKYLLVDTEYQDLTGRMIYLDFGKKLK